MFLGDTMRILNDGSADWSHYNVKRVKKEPEIPICPNCKKPLTQCKCKDNDLKKGG